MTGHFDNDRDQCCYSPLNFTTRLPAVLYWGIVLVASVLVVSVGGCKKNDETVKPPPPSVHGVFPEAEPEFSNAIIRGDIPEIRQIIESKTDVNIRDALERTPLHIAAFSGQTEAIELLLQADAEIDTKDHTGMTPLHAAVISGGHLSVQLLLDKGADINAKTDVGQTVLHLSAATGQPKLTGFLIEQGADVQSKDFEERLPLFYAKKNYHPQTTAVIEQAMAKAKKAVDP